MQTFPQTLLLCSLLASSSTNPPLLPSLLYPTIPGPDTRNPLQPKTIITSTPY